MGVGHTSEKQRKCYQKIARFLRNMPFVSERTDQLPEFIVRKGSIEARVILVDWPEGDDTLIITRAYIASKIELTPDLMRFLLEKKNGGMPFGAFGLGEDGSLFFEQALRGSTCNKLELEDAINAVLTIADADDDEILLKWKNCLRTSEYH